MRRILLIWFPLACILFLTTILFLRIPARKFPAKKTGTQPQQETYTINLAWLANPEIHYVSIEGDHANPGTIQNPWKSVQYAVDHVHPGALIYLRSGTFRENVSIQLSGLEAHPIQLTNFPSESVTVDGGSSPAITGLAKDWIIQGLTLKSTADRTLWLEGIEHWQILDNTIYGAVYIQGPYNLFQGNHVDGSQAKGNQNGVTDGAKDSHHNSFISNTIHDFRDRGLWSVTSTHDNSFIGNHVYNIYGAYGACIDVDSAIGVTYRNFVRNNTVHNCTSMGIELENSFDTLVENNLVHDTGIEGIVVINYDSCELGGENDQYGSADGDCRGVILETIIRQNILYHTGTTGGIVCYDSAGVKVVANIVTDTSSVALFLNNDKNTCHHWEVYDNIFANNTRAEISVYSPASFSREEYNLVSHPGINAAYQVFGNQMNFYNHAQWVKLTGLGSNTIESDPLFIQPVSHNFHLYPNSPAVNHGIDPGIRMDFDGLPRPLGSGYDIGAYEQAGK
jgi:parallel beta-helix repeat protein